MEVTRKQLSTVHLHHRGGAVRVRQAMQARGLTDEMRNDFPLLSPEVAASIKKTLSDAAYVDSPAQLNAIARCACFPQQGGVFDSPAGSGKTVMLIAAALGHMLMNPHQPPVAVFFLTNQHIQKQWEDEFARISKAYNESNPHKPMRGFFDTGSMSRRLPPAPRWHRLAERQYTFVFLATKRYQDFRVLGPLFSGDDVDTPLAERILEEGLHWRKPTATKAALVVIDEAHLILQDHVSSYKLEILKNMCHRTILSSATMAECMERLPQDKCAHGITCTLPFCSCVFEATSAGVFCLRMTSDPFLNWRTAYNSFILDVRSSLDIRRWVILSLNQVSMTRVVWRSAISTFAMTADDRLETFFSKEDAADRLYRRISFIPAVKAGWHAHSVASVIDENWLGGVLQGYLDGQLVAQRPMIQRMYDELHDPTALHCGVCHEQFTEKRRPAILVCCLSRAACVDCISTWLARAGSCLYCRRTGMGFVQTTTAAIVEPPLIEQRPEGLENIVTQALGKEGMGPAAAFSRLVMALASSHLDLKILCALPPSISPERAESLLESVRRHCWVCELKYRKDGKRDAHGNQIVTVQGQRKLIEMFERQRGVAFMYTTHDALSHSTTAGLDLKLDMVIDFHGEELDEAYDHQAVGRLARYSRKTRPDGVVYVSFIL